jgi:hypothetical protein
MSKKQSKSDPELEKKKSELLGGANGTNGTRSMVTQTDPATKGYPEDNITYDQFNQQFEKKETEQQQLLSEMSKIVAGLNNKASKMGEVIDDQNKDLAALANRAEGQTEQINRTNNKVVTIKNENSGCIVQ